MAPDPTTPSPRTTILLVDDQRANLAVLEAILADLDVALGQALAAAARAIP